MSPFFLVGVTMLVVPIASPFDFVLCGPVSSCSASATDPCCSLGSYPPNSIGGIFFDYLLLIPPIDGTSYQYCGTNNPDEIGKQYKVDAIGAAFVRFNCFNGKIASSPGNSIEDLTFSGYETLISKMGCKINFKWNGTYSDWGTPTSCQPITSTLCTPGAATVAGTQTMTRTCTNPRPYNGGDNCTTQGPSTQTLACQYVCPTAAPVTTAPTNAPTTSSNINNINPASKSSSSTPIGVIIGAVIGGIAVIGILVLIGIYCICRTKSRRGSVGMDPTIANKGMVHVVPTHYPTPISQYPIIPQCQKQQDVDHIKHSPV